MRIVFKCCCHFHCFIQMIAYFFNSLTVSEWLSHVLPGADYKQYENCMISVAFALNCVLYDAHCVCARRYFITFVFESL